MKDHVPDLEHCKKLKEAGWVKPTYFVWYFNTAAERWFLHDAEFIGGKGEWLPAPLLTELLEELKGRVQNALVENLVWEANPCNAAADLWIWKEGQK